MTTITEIYIPSNEFALKETLSQVPNTRFEVEHTIDAKNGRVSLFAWATADDLTKVDEALAIDSSVGSLQPLYECENRKLYLMEWVTRVSMLVYILIDSGARVMSLDGSGEKWRCWILFPSRDALSAAYAYCRDRGLSFDLKEMYVLSKNAQRSHFGLTAVQQEALILAVEKGYFDIPRQATMDELAESLNISRQAVSERLRRGHRRLVASTLILGQADVDPSLLSA